MLPTLPGFLQLLRMPQSGSAIRRMPLWKRLDFDSAEENPACVGLQADEPRRRVGFAAIGIAVDEIRLLLAVQKNCETVVLDGNFLRVPLPGALGGDALVERLAGDIVDRARGAEFLVDVLAGRRAAAPQG